MNELVLGIVLFGAAIPVAVGFIDGLWLLFTLIFIQIFTQVQDPPTVVLETKCMILQMSNTCIQFK